MGSLDGCPRPLPGSDFAAALFLFLYLAASSFSSTHMVTWPPRIMSEVVVTDSLISSAVYDSVRLSQNLP